MIGNEVIGEEWFEEELGQSKEGSSRAVTGMGSSRLESDPCRFVR